MDKATRPPIGVIGLPDLALALTLLGFQVLDRSESIDTFEETISVIVADTLDVTVVAWIAKLPRTVVLPVLTEASLVASVELPSPINDILALAGWGPSTHALGRAVVSRSGAIPTLRQFQPHLVKELHTRIVQDDDVSPESFDHMVETARKDNLAAAATLLAPESSDKKLFGGDDLGKTIVMYGGKGGVGRTTIALLLAQRAANSGLRTVFVEMSTGFSDARSYLRLGDPSLPTVQIAGTNGREPEAVITKERLNAARSSELPDLEFAAVLSPPASMSRAGVAEAFGRAIEYARTRADLVVVDTQITDPDDGLNLTANVTMPVLTAGGWCLGVTDGSLPGEEDVFERTKDFVSHGVSRHRLLLALNKAPFLSAETLDQARAGFEEYGTFVGAAGFDPALESAMNDGVLATDNPATCPLIDAILFRVTGDAKFTSTSSAKRGKLGRRR